jgi:hypothetical protein
MSDKYPGGFVTANAPAGFSVAFNGSSDYLTTANSLGINNFGTGDFTIECWVNFSVVGNGQFISAGSGGQANAYYWQYYSSQLQLGVQGGSSITVASWIPVANTWYHVAVTRSGTNVYQFVNGVQLGTTATSSQSFADGPTYIAYGGAGYFNGYISNARIIKGTALYTTTFTPPTQLFPITSTTLLTCQSPTFIDNSATAATITQNGSPKVSNFTPFAAYQGFNPALGAAAGGVWTLDEAAYYQQNRLWPIYDPYFKNTTLMLHGNGTNAAQNNTFLDSSTNNFTITRNGNTTQGSFTPFSQTGWSNFFSSSANYLTVPYNANFTWSTGARTYEAWVYVTSVAANNAIFALSDLSSSNGFELYINTSSQVVFRYFTTTAQITTTTGTVPLNTWTHVAFVYDGTSNFTIYINGVSSATGTKTGSPVTPTAQLCIGRTNIGTAGDVFFSGYISNARFTTTTVYTSNFTPSNAPLTAVTGTTLLTCQDNRFVDDSANNATVTANGTVSVQAFSPFVPAYITPTTYSNWFDGTGDYLTSTTNAAFGYGTSDFTIEFWLNLTTNVLQTIFSNLTSTSSINPHIYLSTTIRYYTNGTDQITGATLNAGQWYHIALSRASGSTKLFVNGVQSGSTYTDANNYGSTAPLGIGTYWDGGAPTATNAIQKGVISNLRIVKGTAVYTANFTPPTAPLTAITNTTLLTCQSSTFIDNSVSALTLTATGNVQPVTSPTPFPANVDTTTLNSAYSTSLIAGSAYFDGTGDYLTAPNNAVFDFGSGNFTIEAWYYPTVTSPNAGLFGKRANSSVYGPFVVEFASSLAPTFYFSTTGSSWNSITSSVSCLANSWNHIAATRSGSTFTIWVNGVSGGTASTASALMTNTDAVSIGAVSADGTRSVTGYLSNGRLIKGTCLYTSSFVPPLTPLTAVSGTSLLTNFTNGAIFDNTAKNVLETVGNAQISTTQSKWGGSSMYFDGTGDYLVGGAFSSPIRAFGTGDFTIEGWFYTGANKTQIILDTGTTGGSGSGMQVALNSSGYPYFFIFNSTTITSSIIVSLGTWTHIAWVRRGGVAAIYVNGVSGVSTANTSNITDTGLTIGTPNDYRDTSSTFHYNGYIDDFRITTGVARYITNFTPPTSQLQDQ